MNVLKKMSDALMRRTRLDEEPALQARPGHDPSQVNNTPTRPSYHRDPKGRITRERDTNLFTAVPHLVTAQAIRDIDLLLAVTRRIDELYEAGSLDEAHAAVLDATLDAWEATLMADAEKESAQRLSRLRAFYKAEDTAAEELYEEFQQAKDELEDAEAERHRAYLALTGRESARALHRTRAARPLPQKVPEPGTAARERTRAPEGEPVTRTGPTPVVEMHRGTDGENPGSDTMTQIPAEGVGGSRIEGVA